MSKRMTVALFVLPICLFGSLVQADQVSWYEAKKYLADDPQFKIATQSVLVDEIQSTDEQKDADVLVVSKKQNAADEIESPTQLSTIDSVSE